jgi:hypothetical protein
MVRPKRDPASTHIPCGSQGYLLEEALGICAVAWPVFEIAVGVTEEAMTHYKS